MLRLGLGLVLGLGLDYGLGFSSDIRLRQDPQLRVSHLATTLLKLTTVASFRLVTPKAYGYWFFPTIIVPYNIL